MRRTSALRQTEENLADFFNRAPLGLFWVGPDGRVQQVNRAGLDLLGCRRAECLKQPIARYLDAEQVAEALHLLAHRHTLHNFRTRFRRQDGTFGHILVDANGLWSKSRLVFSRWFVRDITRRVELEREILRISEQEKRRLGRDLHDDLCQRLAGVEFLSQTLARHLGKRSDACAARAREIALMAREAMTHTRELPMAFPRCGSSPAACGRHCLSWSNVRPARSR
jgi:PAS domain S-box-containing protein